MTIGLSARYNWNTYHKYVPSTVFDIFDVRPEFRWYYRTTHRTKSEWSVDKFLRERKHPKTWRAHYVGAYASYGDYTLKFGRKGYQGGVIGVGAVAGYGLPMYEYRNGAIDVELGFSVGLQVAQKDVFIHNHEGDYYANILDESKGWHMTPFPVVSELKVAFVWRHKSIKDKVKTDTEKLKIKRHYERNKGDFRKPFEDLTKDYYDETIENTMTSRELREIRANDSLYVAGFVAYLTQAEDDARRNLQNVFPDDMKNSDREDIRDYVADLEKKLAKIMKRSSKASLDKFKKELAGQKKAEKEALKEEKPEKTLKEPKEKKELKEPKEKKDQKEPKEKKQKQKKEKSVQE